MGRPRRLILWDIDYTLIASGRASLAVFDAAVESVVGRHPGAHGVAFYGKTDPEIALQILATMAITGSVATEHLPAILQALEREFERAVEALRRSGWILPGVEAILARLAEDAFIVQTVVTGNIEANARLKLGAFGLDRWVDFEVGGYGSDHHDRDRLVPIVLEKVERTHGIRPDPSSVWVVGDTLRDLACARAGGARCLLVATGRAALAELSAARPDAVMGDLSDTEAVARLLLGDG